MKKINFFVCMAAFAGFALTAWAQSSYESFEAFDTENADDENGWAEGWLVKSGSLESNFELSEMELYNGKSFGSALKLKSGYTACERRISTELLDVEDQSYWFSGFIQVAQLLGDPYGCFYFGSRANSGKKWINVSAGKNEDGNMVWRTNSTVINSDVCSDVPVEVGVPVWFVIRLDCNGTSENDNMYVWFNPDNASDQLDEAEAVGGAIPVDALNDDIATDGIVYLDCGGDQEFIFDEIRFGTSWSEVKEMKTALPSAVTSKCVLSCFSNPAGGPIVVSYTLPEAQDVKVSIYDAMGKEVGVLANEKQDAGMYELTFSTEGMSAGLYVCKLQVGATVTTKSVVIR